MKKNKEQVFSHTISPLPQQHRMARTGPANTYSVLLCKGRGSKECDEKNKNISQHNSSICVTPEGKKDLSISCV